MMHQAGDQTGRFRFSIARLLAFAAAVCVVFALARWHPGAAMIIAPAVIGPIAAQVVVRSVTSAVLGVLSGYFWTAALSVVAVPAGLALVAAGFNSVATACWMTILASALGGILGGCVELSRLKFKSRRSSR